MINVASPQLGDAEFEAVKEVMQSGMLAQGKKVAELEEKFASYCGTKHGIAVGNGTQALHIALLAMGIGSLVGVLSGIEKYYHRNVRLLGVIPTFYQANARLSRAIIGQITDRLGASAVLHPVRSNIALAEAPSHGMTIFQYQPRSNGAYDYLHLANQVENLS